MNSPKSATMKIGEIQTLARLVGLTCEKQVLGYRLRETSGLIIANHLPESDVRALVLARYDDLLSMQLKHFAKTSHRRLGRRVPKKQALYGVV
jgi:hypothetical protein